MDTFDGSKPNLINSKLLKDIESKLNIPNKNDETKIINGISFFYKNFIEPNMFFIIVILLFIFYLTIRYILKQDKDEKKNVSDEDTDSDDSDDNDDNDRIKKKMLKTDLTELLLTEKNKRKNIIHNSTNNIGFNNKLNNKLNNNLNNKLNNQPNKLNDESNNESNDEYNDESDNEYAYDKISDHISDDYLLTDDDMQDDSYVISNNIIPDEIFTNRNGSYDINTATSLIFN